MIIRMRGVKLAACLLFYGTKLFVSFIFVNINMVNSQNIALGKQTKQSSDLASEFFSYLAVDGTINQNSQFGVKYTCTHTKHEPNSWWSVDLGAIYIISRVIIWGRNDCCKKRRQIQETKKKFEEQYLDLKQVIPTVCTDSFIPINIFLHNIDRLSSFSIDAIMPVKPRKCGPYQFGNWTDFYKGEISECFYQNEKVDFLNATCQQNTVGQFVRIQLEKTEFLTLCEVEIFGRQLPSAYIGGRESYKCGASGHRIVEDFVETDFARSIIACVYMCSVRPECYASSYNKATQECQQHVAERESNSLTNMIQDPDWDVFGSL